MKHGAEHLTCSPPTIRGAAVTEGLISVQWEGVMFDSCLMITVVMQLHFHLYLNAKLGG